jgi:glycosyltransferase involved in cell wall biosynthesis
VTALTDRTRQMTSTTDQPSTATGDDAVDDAAVARFADEYGAPRLGSVAVVIAAYDEEDALGGVLTALPATVEAIPVTTIVVDDGSTDATAEVARKHGVLVVEPDRNRGQGAALRLGYRVAREHGATYIATLDADGQYDPSELRNVLLPLLRDEADFVTGSRRLGNEHTTDQFRRLGVRFYAWLITRLTGQRITDTSNGLRAMRAVVTSTVALTQPQYQASELLIGALAHGYRVVEVPTTMRERAAGESKKGNNLMYGTRFGLVVLSSWFRERARRRELAVRSDAERQADPTAHTSPGTAPR